MYFAVCSILDFMATIQRFEDLEIWQKARLISQKTYPLTFINPINEDFRYANHTGIGWFNHG